MLELIFTALVIPALGFMGRAAYGYFKPKRDAKWFNDMDKALTLYQSLEQRVYKLEQQFEEIELAARRIEGKLDKLIDKLIKIQ